MPDEQHRSPRSALEALGSIWSGDRTWRTVTFVAAALKTSSMRPVWWTTPMAARHLSAESAINPGDRSRGAAWLVAVDSPAHTRVSTRSESARSRT